MHTLTSPWVTPPAITQSISPGVALPSGFFGLTRAPRTYPLLAALLVVAGLSGVGPATAQNTGANTGTTAGGSAGTLGSVGTGVNGQPTGTSGSNPGVSGSNGTAGTPSANSRTTLRAVGRTAVPGVTAGTSGTDPGVSSPTPGISRLDNPRNRNPARRSVVPGDALPPPLDSDNSSTRPTQSGAPPPDDRDTLITPDPSRYTVVPQPKP